MRKVGAPLLRDAALLLAFVVACGSDSGETTDEQEFRIYQNDFSCAPPGQQTLDTNCESRLASTASLAMTPRCAPSFIGQHRALADADRLEMLAALVSGAVVADQGVYERIVSDVLRIRELYPELKSIVGFRQSYEGLWLNVEPETFEQMERGQYDAWDCLNTLFKARTPRLRRSEHSGRIDVLIDFDGIHDWELVAPEYERLPGVIVAQALGLVFAAGYRPTTCVTPGESEWHYVFRGIIAACPHACENVYHHFVTLPDGEVERAEAWEYRPEVASPPWLDDYVTRDVCF